MANLQVKNVPPEIYDELRRRATAEHVTIRDYVLALLQRDQQLPTMPEWLAGLDARAPFATERDEVAVRGLVEAERDERDRAIGSGLTNE